MPKRSTSATESKPRKKRAVSSPVQPSGSKGENRAHADVPTDLEEEEPGDDVGEDDDVDENSKSKVAEDAAIDEDSGSEIVEDTVKCSPSPWPRNPNSPSADSLATEADTATPKEPSSSPSESPSLTNEVDPDDSDNSQEKRKEIENDSAISGSSENESGNTSVSTAITEAPKPDDSMVLIEQEQPEKISSKAIIPFQGVDAFPKFHSGDVVISLELGSQVTTLQLHSAVLVRHSAWFAQSLREAVLEKDSQTWYLYVLKEGDDQSFRLARQRTCEERPTFPQLTDDEPFHIVKTEALEGSHSIGSSSHSAEPESGEFHALPHTLSSAAAIQSYIQIFGCFYNTEPSISMTEIGVALKQSEGLIRIAEELECLPLIRPYLGNVFGQFRKTLYLAIKANPPRWIQLAVLLENPSIFAECLIHIVGAHPAWPWPTNRASLPLDLRRLVARKSEELDLKCNELDRQLLLNTIRVGRGSVSPGNGHTETWIVVQMFRDAIASQLHSMRTTKQMAMGRGALYRRIRKGGSDYMEVEEVRAACGNILQSKWKDLTEDLNHLKTYAKAVVEELSSNELMIDPDTHNIGYLACTRVDAGDYPWNSTPSVMR